MRLLAKKIGLSLGTPVSMEAGVKFGAAIVDRTVLVKWAQDKKYLPVDPFKTN